MRCLYSAVSRHSQSSFAIINIEGGEHADSKTRGCSLLNRLPEDCSLEDIQYHLYVLQKTERRMKDVAEGRLYTQDEVEKKMSKWLEK